MLGFVVNPSAAVVGVIVGLLVGLTGMGGGPLMTRLLILVLGVRPLTAVGTGLVYSVITKAVGTAVHSQQGTVDRNIAFRLAYGSVPGALLGVFLLHLLKQRLDIAAID